MKSATTHPLFLDFHTWSIGVWQDSSTSLQLPALSLAVIVLMEDVNTTLLTDCDFRHDFRRFRVPWTAGSMMFDWTYASWEKDLRKEAVLMGLNNFLGYSHHKKAPESCTKIKESTGTLLNIELQWGSNVKDPIAALNRLIVAPVILQTSSE